MLKICVEHLKNVKLNQIGMKISKMINTILV